LCDVIQLFLQHIKFNLKKFHYCGGEKICFKLKARLRSRFNGHTLSFLEGIESSKDQQNITPCGENPPPLATRVRPFLASKDSQNEYKIGYHPAGPQAGPLVCY
jgi:hypothetical protein